MKQYHYEQVQKPNKSSFDLSHEKKFTMKHGDLVPCLVQEVIPGDKFSISQEMLLRNMPLIAPMMHRVNVFTHFFFVPNRIVWAEWEKFITGSETVNLPKIKGKFSEWLAQTEVKIGGLADYMGLPITQMNAIDDTQDFAISQLPFRAYQQIYNDYYRDQNLDDEAASLYDISLDIEPNDGDGSELLMLRKRNLEKDYFTSGLPQPQFCNPVSLPLGDSAPVFDNGNPLTLVGVGGNVTGGDIKITQDGTFPTIGHLKDVSNRDLKFGSGLIADLSNATASTINDIRRAFALQRYQEALMRGGRRLKEWTLNIFGVNVPDERIQRAEYLGGGKMALQISEVIQSVSDTENPLGNLGGHGVAGGEITGFSRYFTEHGYIIGIMSILPKTGYFQGVPKNLLKFDKFDYYTPPFAHIGEQAILYKEIFLEDVDDQNDLTFAYTPRYAEYRDNHDTVAGEFRTTLKHWHMAREFATKPSLNDIFIKMDNGSFNRVFAVTDDSHKFVVQTYLRIHAIRPISKFGNPI